MREFKAKRRTLRVWTDDDTHFDVHFPRVREIHEFQEDFNKAKDEEKSELVLNFLDVLGLPKNVALDMEMEHLTEIMTIVSGEKKS